MVDVEEKIQQSMNNRVQDQSLIDKLLAKGESDRLTEIVKKKELSRSEVLELMNLLVGVEAKLVKLDLWQRHVINKFFVWIREFVKTLELLIDVEEELFISINDEDLEKLKFKQMLSAIRTSIEHDVKFLVDVYLNLTRTSLSLGNSNAFNEMLKQKYEVTYDTKNNLGVQKP